MLMAGPCQDNPGQTLQWHSNTAPPGTSTVRSVGITINESESNHGRKITGMHVYLRNFFEGEAGGMLTP